jgi:hypothetical protein
MRRLLASTLIVLSASGNFAIGQQLVVPASAVAPVVAAPVPAPTPIPAPVATTLPANICCGMAWM